MATKKTASAPKKVAAKKAAAKAVVKTAAPPAARALSSAAMDIRPTDGSLEVCEAIAAVSGLVTIVSAEPLKVNPLRLFLLPFNDEKVGISDDQMRVFKARLKALLPSIPSAIDGIAEDSSQIVGDVHQIVLLALNA